MFKLRLDQGYTVEQLRRIVHWLFHYRSLGGITRPWALLAKLLGDEDEFKHVYNKTRERDPSNRAWSGGEGYWLGRYTPRKPQTSEADLQRIREEQAARAEARVKEEAERKASEAREKAEEDAREAAQRAALLPLYQEKQERWEVLEGNYRNLTPEEKAECIELLDWLIEHPDLVRLVSPVA